MNCRYLDFERMQYHNMCEPRLEIIKTILLSHEDVAIIANRLYEDSIGAKVELPENIGKMVIIDIETGDYEVDKNGLQAAKRLNARYENTRLFGIRIGYNVAASFGGVMERVSK